MIPSSPNPLQDIRDTTDERKLLILAYTCQGMVKAGDLLSRDYADCMVALAEKLGFGITDETLAKAAAKYLRGEE